jgi:hypothetical protein
MQEVLHDKEIANMKLVRVTFAVSVLVLMTMLSGCIVVPAGPGYYSGSHGYHGPYGSYGGRSGGYGYGGYGYR